ncbi:MAG: beta-lactamase family protein [Pseudomonadales bacterium]|nr:beta-lactamase family protein [Pseudomonadales bacterium]
MKMIKLAASFIVVYFLVACQDSDDNQAAMTELGEGSELDQLVTDKGFTGSILIKKNGEYLLRKSYGFSDYDAQRQNTLQTRYRIGSLTKAFTGMSMLLLKKSGHISSFEDPLINYLPNFPHQDITLSHLLTMRSGITDYKDHIDWESTYTPLALYELISSLVIKFPADSEFDYNNSNYTLLGYLIEQLSGQSYIEYVQEHILKPLNLPNTEYGATDIQGEVYAKGYVGDYQMPQNWDMSFSYASGGLSSNIPDMERWAQSLQENRLASVEETQEMFNATDDYGYGWITIKIAGIEAVLHDGGLPGFVAIMGMIPKDDSLIIILCNNSDFDINGLNELIILTQFLSD